MLQPDPGKPEAKLTGPASPRFGHDFNQLSTNTPAPRAIQTELAIDELEDSYERDADRLTEQVMRTPAPQLQRKCACGSQAMASGEHGECDKKKWLRLQTKLTVNEPGDFHEREADVVADQVMGTHTKSGVSGAPSRIQRFTSQPTGQTEVAPASVDRVLASSSTPLTPSLRQDMEQQFGHDFSRVRVHSDTASAQSARDVCAHAYTVGNDVVFGVGKFAPESRGGRRLLAHELAHVVQQDQGTSARHAGPGFAAVVRRQVDPTPAPPVPAVSPEDMVRVVVDQRHWIAGHPMVLEGEGLPGGTLAEGARGRGAGAGYQTNAAIQILDASGNQVAFETSRFGSAGPHAEPQAMARLQQRLAGAQVTGGRMIVAVDQYACPDCMTRLRYFARQNGLSGFEVWVPVRGEVTPKTAARTAATRPAAMETAATTPGYRSGARLVQGETFVTPARPAGNGWFPPAAPSLLNLGQKVRSSRAPSTVVEPGRWHPLPTKTVANLRAAVNRARAPKASVGRGVVRGALGVAPQLIDWGAQLYEKGHIEFGTFAPTGERLAISPTHGIGTVTSHVESLSTEMQLLTPEEAERVLKEGEFFVNKSGPVTSKLSPLLMSSGHYEWFELWQIVNGRAAYTKCRTDKGSSFRDISKRDWTEADLRAVWNRRSPFRCPPAVTTGSLA